MNPPSRYRCTKCGNNAEVTIKIISASCMRCGKSMRRVNTKLEQPSLFTTR